MNLPLESPSKRRKTNTLHSDPSKTSVVTSTPLEKSSFQPNPLPEVSAIVPAKNLLSSSTSSSSLKSLQEGGQRTLVQRANTSTTSGDLEEESTFCSELDQSTSSSGHHRLDYDAFFENLGRFRKAGKTWQAFKPLREDAHIYTQILNDVKLTEEIAEKTADYCEENLETGLYLLIRFIMDCAGYQNLNIEGIPMQNKFKALFKKVDSFCKDAEVFKSLKFLFNQKDNLAVILQMAIFRFIQKFVRFSYTSGFLFGCQFTYFMELPGLLCEARWINLMYTGAIFNMKILTAICMVRVEVEQKRHQIKAEYLKLLDTHITTSYAKVTKVCISDFLKLAQLKVAYINELELWIDFSPRVFVDHYQCWKVLTDLLLDSRDKSGSEPVRLAALGLLKKLILNEDCVRYLKNDAIEAIIKRVADRFEDVSDAVLIKALDVYNSMSVHYLSTIQNQETIYRSMIELIGDSNYEIAKAAGNCLVNLLKLEVADDMELLISLARIANNYHSDKKHFVVEALIEDKSKIFQNWEQFVEFFNNTAAATDMAEKITVSDILVEAVHQTLVGKSTKTREKSREVAVLRETHKAVADCFLPELKMLLFKFREQAEILQNFLKVAMQIDVLEITDQHAQYLNSVLVKLLPKLFAYHENVDCLRAMTEFLLHFSNCDHTKSEFEKLIAVLKQEQADKFLESLETKDHSMIFQQAKKLLVMFERFDMNDHLSWQVCLDCWDQLDETDLKNEFVLYMMQCCRHSLLFKLKKLNATLLPRSQQYESVRQLVAERGEFLGNCFNIMEHLKGDMRKYAWVEVSETYLDWGKELEKISKQKYFLQNTLPTLDKNQEAMKLYFRVYDKYIVANEKLPNTEKQKYAMFIVNMASFGMFPVTNVDVVFKYYDKMYETYNEVIEKTIDYFKVEPLVGPGLVFSAIKARYLTVLERRGAVDLKTLEAKDILSLTRRFANLNSVKGLAGTILIFSIEYVSKSNEYDFFIYVRPFVDCVPPNKNNELLAKTRASIPAAVKHDSVLYFLNRLIEGSAAPELRPKHQKKTKPPGKALPAALEVETTSKKRDRRADPKDSSTPSTGKTPQKGAKARGKKQQQKLTQSTESGSSDMSIHDTSDESDEFTSGLENLTLEK